MLMYEMGSYALVERDAGAFGDAAASQFLAACVAADVERYMAARHATVAFKKACLRLYHETQRLARDLERLSAFFFVDRTGGEPESAPPGAPQRGVARGRDWCSDAPDYAELTAHLNLVRGACMALHEYRDVAKAACLLPRHWDGERPERCTARGLWGKSRLRTWLQHKCRPSANLKTTRRAPSEHLEAFADEADAAVALVVAAAAAKGALDVGALRKPADAVDGALRG